MPFIKTGKLRALAVTSPQRWPTMSDLPTVAEAGVPGYEFTIWWGLLAPARTAPAIVSALQAETRKSVLAPDIKEKLYAQGVDAVGGTPQEFTALIEREVAKWKIVAKDAGIQLDY